MNLSPWHISIIVYTVVALISVVPVVHQLVTKPKPVEIPADIRESPDFSEEAKAKIRANFSRISGALGFWRHQAKNNRVLNVYVAWWVIPSSILVPTLTQATAGENIPAASWLITLISTHAAIALVLVQRLKTETNFRAYREGESAFYDAFRKLLDNPKFYGKTEEEQLATYFEKVESVRKEVRGEELTNLANLTT